MSRLELRDGRLLMAGVVAAAAMLLSLLAPRTGEPNSTIKILRPPQHQASTAAPISAPTVRAPASAPSTEGLRLFGLLGGGAIIGLPEGGQRLVRIGREVLPGLRIERIEQHHVILVSIAGETRLGFDGASRSQAAARETVSGTTATGEAALREETLRHRVGLEPRRIDGRVSGFTVRRGASLPRLRRAGLRPGDLILRVNGSAFDEERMLELAWQMDNSERVEFEIERGGRRAIVAANTKE